MVSRVMIAIAAFLAAGLTPAVAQVPQFHDYAASAQSGPSTPLKLTRDDMSYRTRLREVASQPANFAGHYTVATWGCGTSCEMGAAIDHRSGRVIWLPGTICCERMDQEDANFERVVVKLDSRLLVLSGLINEGGSQGTHFYLLEGDKFVHLADAPFPQHMPSQ